MGKAASAGVTVLAEQAALAGSFGSSHPLLGGPSFHGGFDAEKQGIVQRNKWPVK